MKIQLLLISLFLIQPCYASVDKSASDPVDLYLDQELTTKLDDKAEDNTIDGDLICKKLDTGDYECYYQSNDNLDKDQKNDK